MKKVSYPGQLIQNARLDFSHNPSDEIIRHTRDTLSDKESSMKKLDETKGFKKQDLSELKGKIRPRRAIDDDEAVVTTQMSDAKVNVTVMLHAVNETKIQSESEKNAPAVIVEQEMHPANDMKSGVTPITGGEISSVTEMKTDVVATTEPELHSTILEKTERAVSAQQEMQMNDDLEKAAAVTTEQVMHSSSDMKNEMAANVESGIQEKSEATVVPEGSTQSGNVMTNGVDVTTEKEMRLIEETKNETVSMIAPEMRMVNETGSEGTSTTEQQIPSESEKVNGASSTSELVMNDEVVTANPSVTSSENEMKIAEAKMQATDNSTQNGSSDGSPTARPEISTQDLSSKSLEEVTTENSAKLSTESVEMTSSSASDISTTILSSSAPNDESSANREVTEQSLAKIDSVSKVATLSPLMDSSSVETDSSNVNVSSTERSIQATTQDKSISTSKTFPIDFSKVKKSKYLDVKEEVESKVAVVYAKPASAEEEKINEELKKKLDSMIRSSLNTTDGPSHDDDRHHIQHIPLGKRLIIYKKIKPSDKKAIKELIYDSLQTANQTDRASGALNETVSSAAPPADNSTNTVKEATEASKVSETKSNPEKDSDDTLEAAQSSQVPVYVLSPGAANSSPAEAVEEEHSAKIDFVKKGSGAPFNFASRFSPPSVGVKVTDTPHTSTEHTNRPTANRGRIKFQESIMNDQLKEKKAAAERGHVSSTIDTVSTDISVNHPTRKNFDRPSVGSVISSSNSPVESNPQVNPPTNSNSRLVIQTQSILKKPVPSSASPSTDSSPILNHHNAGSNTPSGVSAVHAAKNQFEQSPSQPAVHTTDSSGKFEFQNKPPTTPEVKHYLINHSKAEQGDGTAKYEFIGQTESNLKGDAVVFPNSVEHESKPNQNQTKEEKTLYSQSTEKDGTVQLIENQAAIYQERAQEGDSSPVPPTQSESSQVTNTVAPSSHVAGDKTHHSAGSVEKDKAASSRRPDYQSIRRPEIEPPTHAADSEKPSKFASPSRIRGGPKKQNGLKSDPSNDSQPDEKVVEQVSPKPARFGNRHRFGSREPSKHISSSNEQVEGHQSRFGAKRPAQKDSEEEQQAPSTRHPEQESGTEAAIQTKFERRKHGGFKRGPSTQSPVNEREDAAVRPSRVRGEKHERPTFTPSRKMQTSILVADSDSAVEASDIDETFDDNKEEIIFAETNSRGALAVPLREGVAFNQNSFQPPQQFATGFAPIQRPQTPADTSPDRIPGPAVQNFGPAVQSFRPTVQSFGPAVQAVQPIGKIQTPASTSPDRIPGPAFQGRGPSVQTPPVVQTPRPVVPQTPQPTFHVPGNAVQIPGPAVQNSGSLLNALGNALRIGGASQSARPIFNIPENPGVVPANANRAPIFAPNTVGNAARFPVNVPQSSAFSTPENAARVPVSKGQDSERPAVSQQYFNTVPSASLQKPQNLRNLNNNNIIQQPSTLRPTFPPNVNIQDAINPKFSQNIRPTASTFQNTDLRLQQNILGTNSVFNSNAANNQQRVITQNSQLSNSQFDSSRIPANQLLNPGTRFEVQQQANQKYFPNPGSVFNIPLLQPSVPLATTTPAPAVAPSSLGVLQRMPGYIMQQFRNLFSSQQENQVQTEKAPEAQEVEPAQEQPTRFTIPLARRPVAFGGQRQDASLINSIRNDKNYETTNSQSVLKALEALKLQSQTQQPAQISQQDRTAADKIRESQLLETLNQQLLGNGKQQAGAFPKRIVIPNSAPAGTIEPSNVGRKTVSPSGSALDILKSQFSQTEAEFAQLAQSEGISNPQAGRKRPQSLKNRRPTQTFNSRKEQSPIENIQANRVTQDLSTETAIRPETTNNPSLTALEVLKLQSLQEAQSPQRAEFQEHVAKVEKTISPSVSAFEILQSQFSQTSQPQQNEDSKKNDEAIRVDSNVESDQVKKEEQHEAVQGQEQTSTAGRQQVQKGGRRQFPSRSRVISDQVSRQEVSTGNENVQRTQEGVYKRKKTQRVRTGGQRKKFKPRPRPQAVGAETQALRENFSQENSNAAETSSSPVPKRLEVPGSSPVAPSQAGNLREGATSAELSPNPSEAVAESRNQQADTTSKTQASNQYAEQMVEQMGVSVEPDQVLLINDGYPPIRSMFNSAPLYAPNGEKRAKFSPSSKLKERNHQQSVSDEQSAETSTSSAESTVPNLSEVPVFPSRATQPNSRPRIVPVRRRLNSRGEIQRSPEKNGESTRIVSTESPENPPRVKKSDADSMNERFVSAMYSLSQFLRS
ncbi:unnamed protein product [Bemisia tabaci]|uniref:Uncharacterized protein n=2 Tax=Bemisia tabaci TaxID=7038 RepID=A0A9P0AE22_BEMTA|nr:unnamed protein product [Bemisia tabaci]